MVFVPLQNLHDKIRTETIRHGIFLERANLQGKNAKEGGGPAIRTDMYIVGCSYSR